MNIHAAIYKYSHNQPKPSYKTFDRERDLMNWIKDSMNEDIEITKILEISLNDQTVKELELKLEKNKLVLKYVMEHFV